jgi:hypothetical protein
LAGWVKSVSVVLVKGVPRAAAAASEITILCSLIVQKF